MQALVTQPEQIAGCRANPSGMLRNGAGSGDLQVEGAAAKAAGHYAV